MSDDDRDKVTGLHSHQDGELEALYRQTPKVEPPTALDEAIRGAARQRPAVRSRRSYVWLGGVAASVVVGLLLVQLYPDVVAPPQEARQKAGAASAESDTTRVMSDAPLQQRAEKLVPSPAFMSTAPTGAASRAPAAEQQLEMALPTVNATGGLIQAESALPADAVDETAEALLETIREQIAADQFEQAGQSYRELQQRFPDFVIDEKTRVLIESALSGRQESEKH